jgi:hypothetical protein
MGFIQRTYFVVVVLQVIFVFQSCQHLFVQSVCLATCYRRILHARNTSERPGRVRGDIKGKGWCGRNRTLGERQESLTNAAWLGNSWTTASMLCASCANRSLSSPSFAMWSCCCCGSSLARRWRVQACTMARAAGTDSPKKWVANVWSLIGVYQCSNIQHTFRGSPSGWTATSHQCWQSSTVQRRWLGTHSSTHPPPCRGGEVDCG